MHMKKVTNWIGLFAGAMLSLTGATVNANDLPAPRGEVILTVSGQVSTTNAQDTAVLDRDMIESFEPMSFKTSTIWTEGEIEFTGVPLGALLRHLGVESGTLKATAINDYAIEIPVEDALAEPGIIAYEMNGQPMSVREKGPLWIVYPYDAEKKFQSETYYSRSIWQLDRIVVEE